MGPALQIQFPTPDHQFDQDTEHCHVLIDGTWEEFRFHDYHRIYSVPGLYERLFHEILECQSPDVVAKLLKEKTQQDDILPENMRVLDLGAGNGLVGEHLVNLGAGLVVGVDIIPEAAAAADRDRPGVYQQYFIVDMTCIPQQIHSTLAAKRFNTLSCVAALGYADIPPAAFRTAFNLIGDGGLIAFNIKDRFLSEDDTSGFAQLVRRCQEEKLIELSTSERYRHRRSVNGEPLYYVALVGTKLGDIPVEFVR